MEELVTTAETEEVIAQPAYRPRLFTVDEYYRMAEAGVLSWDERVELLEGHITTMSPIGSPHAARVSLLTHLLVTRLGDTAIVSVQNPVRLSRRSEPVPDLTVLKPQADHYASGHPGPEDVLLLIEVADTTIKADRRYKMPLYARHGIREAWLVNLSGETLEIYRQPTPEGYQDVQVLRRGDGLLIEAFPEIRFDVVDVLGS